MLRNIDKWRGQRAARLAAVMGVIGAARAVEFRKDGSDVVYYVHQSTYGGKYSGTWQVSRVDSLGPSGHHNEDTLELAVASAIGAHPNSYWNEGDRDYQPVEVIHASQRALAD